MSQLTIFTNVPCNKLNWFLPVSYTTTEHTQLQNNLKEKYLIGELLSITAHTKCHKIFFHMPCKPPSTSMFLLEMMMHAQNLLCMWFGITQEMNKILTCTICSMVLMSQNVLYIVWKKAWRSFFRYTEFFEFQELTLTIRLHWKKPKSTKPQRG